MPEEATGEGDTIVVTYTLKRAPWGLLGRTEQEAPELRVSSDVAVPVLRTAWDLSVPDDYRVLELSGNVAGEGVQRTRPIVLTAWAALTHEGGLPYLGLLALCLAIAASPRARGLLVGLWPASSGPAARLQRQPRRRERRHGRAAEPVDRARRGAAPRGPVPRRHADQVHPGDGRALRRGDPDDRHGGERRSRRLHAGRRGRESVPGGGAGRRPRMGRAAWDGETNELAKEYDGVPATAAPPPPPAVNEPMPDMADGPMPIEAPKPRQGPPGARSGRRGCGRRRGPARPARRRASPRPARPRTRPSPPRPRPRSRRASSAIRN